MPLPPDPLKPRGASLKDAGAQLAAAYEARQSAPQTVAVHETVNHDRPVESAEGETLSATEIAYKDLWSAPHPAAQLVSKDDEEAGPIYLPPDLLALCERAQGASIKDAGAQLAAAYEARQSARQTVVAAHETVNHDRPVESAERDTLSATEIAYKELWSNMLPPKD
eukprot:5506577-Pyramimonas_sp.AAC.1